VSICSNVLDLLILQVEIICNALLELLHVFMIYVSLFNIGEGLIIDKLIPNECIAIVFAIRESNHRHVPLNI
jgi:hypothetical protein